MGIRLAPANLYATISSQSVLTVHETCASFLAFGMRRMVECKRHENAFIVAGQNALKKREKQWWIVGQRKDNYKMRETQRGITTGACRNNTRKHVVHTPYVLYLRRCGKNSVPRLSNRLSSNVPLDIYTYLPITWTLGKPFFFFPLTISTLWWLNDIKKKKKQLVVLFFNYCSVLYWRSFDGGLLRNALCTVN